MSDAQASDAGTVPSGQVAGAPPTASAAVAAGGSPGHPAAAASATGQATVADPRAPGGAVPAASGPLRDGTGEIGGSGAGRLQPIELLHGVEMTVTVELGRTRMLVRDLLGLRVGSVVELDRPAGNHVEVLVNGVAIARGEVVVVDDEIGVRLTEILGSAQPAGPKTT